jgi:hypothetical protein
VVCKAESYTGPNILTAPGRTGKPVRQIQHGLGKGRAVLGMARPYEEPPAAHPPVPLWGWSPGNGAKTPSTTINKHIIIGNQTSGGTDGLGSCTPRTGGGARSTAGERSNDGTGGLAGGLFSSSPILQRNGRTALTGATITPVEQGDDLRQNAQPQQQATRSANTLLNTKARIKIAMLNINGCQETGKGPLSKWADIVRVMSENKISILAVQETHLDTVDKDTLNELYGNKIRIINSADPE